MESTAQPAGLPAKVTFEITGQGWKCLVTDKHGSTIGSYECVRATSWYNRTEKAEVFETAMRSHPLLLEAIRDVDAGAVAIQLTTYQTV